MQTENDILDVPPGHDKVSLLDETGPRRTGRPWKCRLPWALFASLLCLLMTGCAAMTNPVANGIPVRLLPDELLAPAKGHLKPIPLTLLRQPQADVYRLAPGDTLGVYIEGVLGKEDELPPVNFSDVANVPPSVGFPVAVRDDGTISLPQVAPVQVEGLTITEAERTILDACNAKQLLHEDRQRVLVSLMSPRAERVLVIREDSPNQRATIRTRGIQRSRRSTIISGNERGTGAVLDLPAYENDVLNALTLTGGLPGPDAANEIIIQRGLPTSTSGAGNDKLGAAEPQQPVPDDLPTHPGQQIIRIPLSVVPGEPLSFSPEDIVLKSGDVVLIRKRDDEYYHTGGLLPPSELLLPRDRDVTVVEAILGVEGPLLNGAVNTNNLNGTIVIPGVGNPSPSLLTVIRRVPGGRQVPIRVDLNEAVRDSRENMLVQAGDILILQETPGEATGRYISQVFSFRFFSDIIDRGSTAGTTALTVP